jgi:hypothetical protein
MIASSINRTLLAGKVAAQIEDRVADKLAGPVIRDVAAAVDLMDRDALAGERLVVGQNVGAAGVAAERQDRRVFKQNQRIADQASLTRSDHLSLDPQAFSVGDAAELEEVDPSGG